MRAVVVRLGGFLLGLALLIGSSSTIAGLYVVVVGLVAGLRLGFWVGFCVGFEESAGSDKAKPSSADK